jgi:hypothetical protein
MFEGSGKRWMPQQKNRRRKLALPQSFCFIWALNGLDDICPY